jgi:hypothetical protein
MGEAHALFHLAGAMRRAAGRVILSFLGTAVVIVAGGEGAYVATHSGHIGGTLFDVAIAFVAIGWAIAVSLFVLVFEVVKGLVAGVRDTARDVSREVGDVGSFARGVAQTIEDRNKK